MTDLHTDENYTLSSKDGVNGTYLTDRKGFSFYIFSGDDVDESGCYDECAKIWPPFTVPEGIEVTVSGETNKDLVGYIRRVDDTIQVTYNGIPLYCYTKDKHPGDVLGHLVKDVDDELWTLVNVEGFPFGLNMSNIMMNNTSTNDM